MAEPWAAGIVLLALGLGLPGVALFLLWPDPLAEAARPGDVGTTGADTTGDDMTGDGTAPTSRRSRRQARTRAGHEPSADSDAFDAERALVAIGVPVACFVVASELLAAARVLSFGTVWAYAGAVAVLAVVAAVLGRAGIAARLRAPDRARRWAVRLPALGLVLAGASAQVALVLSRTDSLIGPTPWYYWQQSVAIARAGHVPAGSREWGTIVDFFDYHLGFNAFGAAVATATRSVDSLFGAQLVRIAVVVGAVLGLWLFARVWGAPRYAAAAAAIALPCIAIYATKLSSFRPEPASYLLALVAPALLHRWFQRPRALLGAAVLVTFVGVTQIHAPGTIVAATLCAATAIAHVRWSWRWVLRTVAVGLALVVVWLGADLVTGHRGPASSSFAKPPSLTATGLDPTYEFAQLATASGPVAAGRLGRNPPSGGSLLQRSLTDGFLVGGTSSYRILMALVAATAIAAVALRRWSIVRYMIAGLAFVALLGLVSLVAATGWDTYVPLRSGYSRFFQFWWFVPLTAAVLCARLVDRRWWRVAVSVVLLVAAGGVWFRSLDATAAYGDMQPATRTLEQLRALKIPSGALVLSNAYTQDFVQYNTTGDGLTDGRAPYLEHLLLRRANRILRLTSEYFGDPIGHPFPFAHYGVRYVLVSTRPNSLGNPSIYRADPAALDRLPTLTHLAAGDGWVLYRVSG